MGSPEEINENASLTRMNRRTFATGAAATAVGAAIVSTGALSLAQDATPDDPPAVEPDATPDAPDMDEAPLAEVVEGIEVAQVVAGLVEPRFLTVSADAVIYYTEAGAAGDEPIIASGEALGEDVTGEQVSQRGMTGRLSAIPPDGIVTPLVEDFWSYLFEGTEIVGPAGVAVDNAGSAYVAVGAPGPFVANIDLTGEEGALFQVDLATGERTVIADLAAYEIEENPDPVAIDSNPYGVAFADGVVYVADAGGNTVIGVDVATGEVFTAAVTGGLPVEFLGPEGNPFRDGADEIDSVPSGVEVGADGTLFVANVTGGPFPPGLAPVLAYDADGAESVFASGLTMLGDLAFSSDGTMYVTQISASPLEEAPGQVVRVSPEGDHEVVIDGLIFPAGLAFDNADNLFVINRSANIPGGGEILRFTGVTTAVGNPLVVAEMPDMPPPEEAPEVPPNGTPEATPAASGAGEAAVTMGAASYSVSELTVAAGATIALINDSALAHDFVIDDLGVNSGMLAGGETATVAIPADAAGEYVYYCSVPGHRAAGMEGVLTVTA